MADVVVRAREIVKSYGAGEASVHALHGVSVDIPRGGFTAIMGPSGSGKSTLMHVLAGLARPTSGSVSVGDVELTELGEDALARLRRERFGFVFQAFNLLPALSARANILLPLTLAGTRADEAWFTELATRLGIADRLDHRPAQLSGGQQQRVAIARALLSRPDVVFADEPTGALDSTTGEECLRLLRRSCDEYGQTIVMVTHDAVAAGWCDRVLTMRDGRLDESAAPVATRGTAAVAR